MPDAGRVVLIDALGRTGARAMKFAVTRPFRRKVGEAILSSMSEQAGMWQEPPDVTSQILRLVILTSRSGDTFDFLDSES